MQARHATTDSDDPQKERHLLSPIAYNARPILRSPNASSVGVASIDDLVERQPPSGAQTPLDAPSAPPSGPGSGVQTPSSPSARTVHFPAEDELALATHLAAKDRALPAAKVVRFPEAVIGSQGVAGQDASMGADPGVAGEPVGGAEIAPVGSGALGGNASSVPPQ